jgi:hypothetical protein
MTLIELTRFRGFLLIIRDLFVVVALLGQMFVPDRTVRYEKFFTNRS